MPINSVMNSIDENKITPNNDFLSGRNPAHKDNLEAVGNPLTGIDAPEYYPGNQDGFSSCTLTELRKKFPRTYKCWDNMKQRRKKGAIIHNEFANFKNFLRHVGPCEDSQYTLDRIDNSDREYAPGKVAWRDKYAQNSNKGNNVYLAHEDGRRLTVAQWATITKQLPATLYKRRAAGWNDMAVITGNHESHTLSLNDNPWPYDTRKGLEAEYRKAALSGHGKSRLVFLRDRAHKTLSYAEKRLCLLAAAIQDSIGYDNDHDEYQAMEGLAEQCCSLAEFTGISNDDLQQMVDENEQLRLRCKNILHQTNEQIEYEQMKEIMFINRHNNIKDADFVKYFNEAYPRPVYTVNKPPESN